MGIRVVFDEEGNVFLFFVIIVDVDGDNRLIVVNVDKGMWFIIWFFIEFFFICCNSD